MALLEVESLSKRFGGLEANKDISFRVEAGEMLAIIGPNGAGKSTLFDSLACRHAPTSGSVRFDGQPLQGLWPEDAAARGLARTFQIPRNFGAMTVLENTMIGALLHHPHLGDARETANAVLREVGLEDRWNQRAAQLNVVGQKRVELARALATQPKLLLLDEVAGGLNVREAQDLIEVLRHIHAGGVTLVIVEHVLEVVMQLAHRVLVLNFGQVIVEDTPEQVVRDQRVIDAYLGSRHAR